MSFDYCSYIVSLIFISQAELSSLKVYMGVLFNVYEWILLIFI